MPRSRSIFIQSDRVLRRSPLALTCPARLMAPPNSSSFSVSVVLPASGWEMIANVRRRATSSASGERDGDSAWSGNVGHEARAFGRENRANQASFGGCEGRSPVPYRQRKDGLPVHSSSAGTALPGSEGRRWPGSCCSSPACWKSAGRSASTIPKVSRRLVPSVLTLAAMAGSILLLGLALKTLPIGTAYAVWTGIGAVGTAILRHRPVRRARHRRPPRLHRADRGRHRRASSSSP